MRTLHSMIYCESKTDVDEFRSAFVGIEQLGVVASCVDWSELQNHLTCRQLECVIVDLDSTTPDQAINIVRRICEVSPDLSVMAVSRETTPEMLISFMRLGRVQYLRWPIDADDLRQLIGQIIEQRYPTSRSGKRIAVIGAAGGAGTTTVAVNLAMELAQITQEQCALIDINTHFGDVTCAYDVAPKHSLLEVCQLESEIDATLIATAFELLPCNVAILGSGRKTPVEYDYPPERMSEIVASASTLFPYLVFDVPRVLGPAVLLTLRAAHHVLIVTQLTIPQVRNASRLFELLLEAGIAEEQIEIVLNRCQSEFERIKPTELEQHLGRPAFAVIPNDYKQAAAARDFGRLLIASAPKSPVRAAIVDMARRLANERADNGKTQVDGGRFLGLFRRTPSQPAAFS